MNQELMRLIHEYCRYITDIRKLDGRIQVKIAQLYEEETSEMLWIELYQAPVFVEKVVEHWIAHGGEIC